MPAAQMRVSRNSDGRSNHDHGDVCDRFGTPKPVAPASHATTNFQSVRSPPYASLVQRFRTMGSCIGVDVCGRPTIILDGYFVGGTIVRDDKAFRLSV